MGDTRDKVLTQYSWRAKAMHGTGLLTFTKWVDITAPEFTLPGVPLHFELTRHEHRILREPDPYERVIHNDITWRAVLAEKERYPRGGYHGRAVERLSPMLANVQGKGSLLDIGGMGQAGLDSFGFTLRMRSLLDIDGDGVMQWFTETRFPLDLRLRGYGPITIDAETLQTANFV